MDFFFVFIEPTKQQLIWPKLHWVTHFNHLSHPPRIRQTHCYKVFIIRRSWSSLQKQALERDKIKNSYSNGRFSLGKKKKCQWDIFKKNGHTKNSYFNKKILKISFSHNKKKIILFFFLKQWSLYHLKIQYFSVLQNSEKTFFTCLRFNVRVSQKTNLFSLENSYFKHYFFYYKTPHFAGCSLFFVFTAAQKCFFLGKQHSWKLHRHSPA